MYTAPDPGYADRVRAIFRSANFVNDLGIVLERLGPGWTETAMPVRPKHLQQDGFVHAGVQATLADHSAGGAAGTLVGADAIVLSVEFKINFLRPSVGERLTCRAEVLRAGRTLIVAESEVFTHAGDRRVLTAKATVTLAVVCENS